MILRRVIEHFRKQEWTAIFLDFVIVVMGVFIGSNVTNWNDARKTHEKSEVYTARLLNDLTVEREYALSIKAYYIDAYNDGLAAVAGLTGQSGADDETILVNAFRAFQYQWYERRSAAFNELISSGDLELVRDSNLRETAIRYYGQSATVYDLQKADGRESEGRRLFDRLVDPNVRRALREQCGDRNYTTKAGVSGVFTIGYQCSPGVDAAAVKNAVDALRGEAEFLPALRRQTALNDTAIFNIEYMIEYTGLEALFAKEASK